MTGIAGVWNLDGRPADTRLLVRMGSAILHRGRDQSATWSHQAIGFIARVGVVTPPSADERQPSTDGQHSLVFDGRLDNREELLSELAGNGLASDPSDPALVLAAY